MTLVTHPPPLFHLFKASEMVHLIKNEFDHILHKTEWMDSETKEKAYKKSKEMTSIVGYPKELANDDALQEHFQGVSEF